MAAPHEALRVAYESSAMEKGEERLTFLKLCLINNIDRYFSKSINYRSQGEMINNISVTRNLLDERLSATDTLFRKYFSKQPTTYLNVDDLVIDTTGLKKSN